MNEDVRVESSVPVQSRISVVTLGELAKWWAREGRGHRTMSRLVSASCELLVEILKSNGKIDGELTVVTANKLLVNLGLHQESLRSRGMKKLSTAVRFEGLREEGIDVRDADRRSYNILHNSHSSMEGRVDVVSVNDVLRRATEVYNELNGKELNVKEKMSDDEFKDKMKEIDYKDKRTNDDLDEFINGIVE